MIFFLEHTWGHVQALRRVYNQPVSSAQAPSLIAGFLECSLRPSAKPRPTRPLLRIKVEIHESNVPILTFSDCQFWNMIWRIFHQFKCVNPSLFISIFLINFSTFPEPSSPIIEMLKPKPRGLDISWRTDVTSKQDRCVTSDQSEAVITIPGQSEVFRCLHCIYRPIEAFSIISD